MPAIERQHTIFTRDEWALAASTFEAARPRAVVIVNSAMATRRHVYRRFGRYLAKMGVHVVTWDYRGIGGSAPGRLGEVDANIEQWGTHDADAVIGWTKRRFPGLPIVVLGHSMGGQILGMAYRSSHVDAYVTVAAQSGYWRLFSWPFRWLVAWLWFAQIPLLSRLFGYYPGRRLGLGMNVPAGVARQWARWGRDPLYLAGRHAPRSFPSYAEIEQPMLSFWVSDDPIAPRRAHRAMLSWYPNAKHRHVTITPRALGLTQVGHFGFFRPSAGNILWPKLLLWIDRVTRDRRTGARGKDWSSAA